MLDHDNHPAIIKFVEKANRATGKPVDSGTPEAEWQQRRPSSTANQRSAARTGSGWRSLRDTR